MENFVIVWTIDGETMSIPHPTQDQALTITRKTLDSCARPCAERLKPCEAPKFERLPLCLWYCCMHYIVPA